MYLREKQSPRSCRRSCQPPSSSSHAAAALIHGPRRRRRARRAGGAAPQEGEGGTPQGGWPALGRRAVALRVRTGCKGRSSGPSRAGVLLRRLRGAVRGGDDGGASQARLLSAHDSPSTAPTGRREASPRRGPQAESCKAGTLTPPLGSGRKKMAAPAALGGEVSAPVRRPSAPRPLLPPPPPPPLRPTAHPARA